MIEDSEMKAAVRKIRAGEAIEGFCFDQEGLLAASDGRKFKVEGEQRLRLIEVKAPKKVNLNPKQDSKAVCACGRAFVRSKFHPYLEQCPECRKKGKAPPKEGRSFVCPVCKEPFTVSKFQPYFEPKACPKCTARQHRKDYRNRKKSLSGCPQDRGI
jgi:hypothetical protein